MQLYYLLVVIVVSDVKVMSLSVAVIFAANNYSAITWVVNNYNIQTEPRFWTESNQTYSEPNLSFSKTRSETKQKKSILHIPNS